MNRFCAVVVLFSTFLLSSGYGGNAERSSPPGTPPAEHNLTAGEVKVMACSLVSTQQVGVIQGAAMTDPTSSEAPQGEFLMTQCYWGSKEPNKSVSLAVIQRDPARSGTRKVTEFCHDTFDKFTDKKNADKEEKEEPGKGGGAKPTASKGSRSEEQEEHSKLRPQKMDGLGEEAFWLANPVGGMLYVLKNDLMLRISVGGPGDQTSKIEKSKALAAKALERL